MLGAGRPQFRLLRGRREGIRRRSRRWVSATRWSRRRRIQVEVIHASVSKPIALSGSKYRYWREGHHADPTISIRVDCAASLPSRDGSGHITARPRRPRSAPSGRCPHAAYFAMFDGDILCSSGVGTPGGGNAAIALHRVDVEFAPTRANRNEWRVARRELRALRVYEDVELRWRQACAAGKPRRADAAPRGVPDLVTHTQQEAQACPRIILDAQMTSS